MCLKASLVWTGEIRQLLGDIQLCLEDFHTVPMSDIDRERLYQATTFANSILTDLLGVPGRLPILGMKS